MVAMGYGRLSSMGPLPRAFGTALNPKRRKDTDGTDGLILRCVAWGHLPRAFGTALNPKMKKRHGRDRWSGQMVPSYVE
jgi:hypothetical protein